MPGTHIDQSWPVPGGYVLLKLETTIPLDSLGFVLLKDVISTLTDYSRVMCDDESEAAGDEDADTADQTRVLLFETEPK